METLYFLVIVPHRDCLPSLEAYRADFFSHGFDGAFSFPAVAPLALLERPLASALLKTAAVTLREQLGDKKLTPAGLETSPAWDGFHFMGPALDLPPISLSAPAGIAANNAPPVVLYHWEKPVLAPVLLAPNTNNTPLNTPASVPAPRFAFFRAMALANLTLNTNAIKTAPAGCESFDADYSFMWELGELHWLPRPVPRANRPSGHGCGSPQHSC
jgi:hypothetical protein